MRKSLFLLLTVVLACSMVMGTLITVGAASSGTITRIYGTETRAIDCKGFTEFYAGQFFAWFMLDTSIDCASGFIVQNQQALGEMTLKNSCSSKIKLGGMTVKQINAGDGNPYSAMIAYEDNGSQKLRISIWLSWGGPTVQSLFQKEVKSKFTVEILDGLIVPGNGYAVGNGKTATIAPTKYELSIVDLEFAQDKNNPGYTSGKDTWMKPMFETLTAQWTVPGTVSSSVSSSKASSVSSSASSSKTSTTVSNVTSETSSVSDVSEVISADSGVSDIVSQVDSSIDESSLTKSSTGENSVNSETGNDKDNGVPVLALVLGVFGVLIVGVGAFMVFRKK